MSIHEPSAGFGIAAPPAPISHRFTVEQYHRMIETGILTENDKVHLIEGCILEMTPIGVPHRYAVDEVYHAVERLLPTGWKAFMQQPITLANSELEPDVSVVRGTGADYKDHHPRPSEIGLLIEVADSSLALDRTTKARLYAAEGIPEYWIVNLIQRQIEVHREPFGDPPTAAYRSLTTFSASEKFALTLFAHACGEIAVASVLP
jgi:Uma2 family endonuclease